MTIKECYAQMGADYEGVLRRMGNAERVQRFAGMFLKDGSYDLLCQSVDGSDGDEAFRAAHSLKGVCANLGLTRLQEEASELTEALRGGRITPEAQPLLETVRREYLHAVQCIQQL